ncbi:unnamed protein product [Didymodactylos carnosus]|uniref:Uncharacterized protein n=1 Tax=Didymodactylos carnosus TaxID=1234261 RepID=A0A815ELW9_9BILA|nr:unnamed protein product [Didymodactylos carnosus]CAF4158755.1 unnamed protein product [Didymodactylos carnosus]
MWKASVRSSGYQISVRDAACKFCSMTTTATDNGKIGTICDLDDGAVKRELRCDGKNFSFDCPTGYQRSSDDAGVGFCYKVDPTINDSKEVTRYTLKRANVQEQENDDKEMIIEICEHCDVKGFFWEKFELHHFPSDTQELSVSIAASYYDDKLILQIDNYRQSGVNREVFVDQ